MLRASTTALMAALLASAMPALADWRDDLGVFRVGMVAGGSFKTADAEPFRLALNEALGMTTDIIAMRDYPAMIDGAAGSRIEYGVFSAMAFAAAEAQCECLEPLAVAHAGDGTGGYYMVLITPSAAGPSLERLKGKRIGVVEPEPGVAGAVMLAEQELAAAGLDISASGPARAPFTDSAAAIAALTAGEIDALLGWSSMTGDAATGYSRGTLQRIAALGGIPAEWRIAWQSSQIPHRVHAVRKNLAAEAKTAIRKMLDELFLGDPLAYDAIEPAMGGGFKPARPGQFDALVAMFRARGVGAAESR